jgi:hypothetical protein
MILKVSFWLEETFSCVRDSISDLSLSSAGSLMVDFQFGLSKTNRLCREIGRKLTRELFYE